MDSKQFDAIARSLVSGADRRGAMRALLGGALGIAGLTDAEAAKTGNCAPECAECATCKVGKCKKKRGKKKCKAGVCEPKSNGSACQNSPCKECQNGTCANKTNFVTCENNPCKACNNGVCNPRTAGTPCENNPCKECQAGQCGNKAGNSACNGAGKCVNGTCNQPPVCTAFALGCNTNNPGACCSFVCVQTNPQTGAGFCNVAANGVRCKANTDCATQKCVGFVCQP